MNNNPLQPVYSGWREMTVTPVTFLLLLPARALREEGPVFLVTAVLAMK